MIKFGNNDTKLYLGANEVTSIYLGSTQVYDGGDTPTPPTPSYDTQYFTTESTSDNNTIEFRMGAGMSTAITTAVTSVSVSTDDGVTWTSMENIGANASLSVTLNNGDKAIWKGEAQGYSIATATTRSTLFSSTGNYKVYGNILSLLYDDNFINQSNPTLPYANCFTNLFYASTGLTDASNLIMRFDTGGSSNRPLAYMFTNCSNLTAAPELQYISWENTPYVFRNMFKGCTSLTVAPELPATTLTQGCYQYMFDGCTSLTNAPVLSATTLANNCYNAMLRSCTSLTVASELPATTLANSCYSHMFDGCRSLTTAPELPATTLAQSCYYAMFFNCSRLNYIKCLATDVSATNCTVDWLYTVAAYGTFIKAASMNDWSTGSSGIPEDWTVQNDDGSPVIDDNDPIGGDDAD